MTTNFYVVTCDHLRHSLIGITFLQPVCVFILSYYYLGSEFYIGFIPNFGASPFIVILTNGEELSTYSVEAPVTGFYRNGAIIANVQNVINLPNSLTGPSYHFNNDLNNEYKEGVYLQTSKRKVAIIGSYQHGVNFDTFFAIPTVDLCLYEYTYFAVSVPANVRSDGSVVIVGTANQTMVNITVPVPADIKISNSANWTSLEANRVYSYKIQRLQMVYIAALTTDLTGTRITSKKPFSLFSGHECAFVPSQTERCDNLMEQIPPTELWGTVYYFAPLSSRTSYTIKIISAEHSTTVEIYCNDIVSNYIINAGEFIEVTYNNQEFCGVYANQVVLVTQFSHGYNSDSQGDPMMTLIPSTSHYTNSITSSTFEISNCYNHYINTIVLAGYYQPEMISITSTGGVSQSLDSLSWVPIMRNNVTEAYAAQVNIPHGVFEVTHANNSALITVIVYGFANCLSNDIEGYGHPGWLMDQLNDGTYIHTYVNCMS